MLEAKIIDRGRGPEIAGTRITVYDVLDYHQSGWHRDMIADTLELSSEQVEVAIRYIEEHRNEVMVEYGEMLARDAPGQSSRAPSEAGRRTRAVPGHGPGAPTGEKPGDPRCGGFSRTLAEKTAERILDYLMRIDEVRGSGRLCVP